MKYLAQDGKIFENEDKCLEYENKIKANVERANGFEKEKDKRWQEIVDAKENYIKLYNKYCDDYRSVGTEGLLNRFFSW